MALMQSYTSSPEIFGGRIPGYPVMSSISSFFEDYVNGFAFSYKQQDVKVSNLAPPPVTKTYQRTRKRSPTVSSDETSQDSKRLKVESPVSSDFEVTQVKIGEVENEVTEGAGEQIKAHLMSLLSAAAAPMPGSVKERVCQFCASGELLFAATPMYCLNCSGRIKERANYYSTPTEHGVKHCFCARCYNNSRSLDISFGNVKVSKATLERKKNDEEMEEPWVQCGRCEGWQHQICALYNDKCDSEEYVCFTCVLKDMESGEQKPKNVGFCAKDLPTTKLSDHIEKRLDARLQQERLERSSKHEGNESSAVLGVEGLVVREVLSVDKTVQVKQQYLDLFPDQRSSAQNVATVQTKAVFIYHI